MDLKSSLEVEKVRSVVLGLPLFLGAGKIYCMLKSVMCIDNKN